MIAGTTGLRITRRHNARAQMQERQLFSGVEKEINERLEFAFIENRLGLNGGR